MKYKVFLIISKGLSFTKYCLKPESSSLRAPCFTELLQWLLLKVSNFQLATLLKNRLRKICFSVNFAKFLRASFFFDRTSPDDCFLCLSVNFETFSEHFFYRAPWGNCYFMCKLQNFNKTNSVKTYSTGVFQAFYTRLGSSHSKAFICLKSLKTVCKVVNLL